MNWKKTGRIFFFPPMIILFILLPVSIGAMLYGMLFIGENSPITIAFYALSFYMLMIWCIRIPAIIRFFRTLKSENKYIIRWLKDPQLRINISLSVTILWNGAYGALQLGMGIYHKSAWFYSLAAYYATLAVLRFFLVRYTIGNKPGEKIMKELIYYRNCGWIFLLINLVLSGIILYMIRENRTIRHYEITTIAMAAYTFFTTTMAIINIFRYRKYNSPVISASRAISLTAAFVSMLSLENTMLVTFRENEITDKARQLFLALSGGAISGFIIIMAVYMIVQANRRLKTEEN